MLTVKGEAKIVIQYGEKYVNYDLVAQRFELVRLLISVWYAENGSVFFRAIIEEARSVPHGSTILR